MLWMITRLGFTMRFLSRELFSGVIVICPSPTTRITPLSILTLQVISEFFISEFEEDDVEEFNDEDINAFLFAQQSNIFNEFRW